MRQSPHSGFQSAGSLLRESCEDLIVSKQKLKQAERMQLVRQNREQAAQTLCFSSRTFVLCGLPVRQLPKEQLLYERRKEWQNSVVAVHIGTSGWSYAHWTNVLYPEGLPAARRLDYYARQFQTVELNASYYRWPSDAAFAGWQRRLPHGFVVTVKAPGALTHTKRLYRPEAWLERIGQGLDHLGPKRGVLLMQLPPSAAFDLPRLAYFLECVPRGLRLCIEFRNPTWLQDGTFMLLEKHGAAYCVMSGAGLPCVLRATASFVYVRLHGPDPNHLYAGSYSQDDLRWWADRVWEWQDLGRDVFVYFNNDGGGNAVRNALTLKGMLEA